jgi:hypothetical protein
MKIKPITITLLILLIPSIALAVFLDTETSNGNTFSATTLDTEISPNTFDIDISIPSNRETRFVLTNIGDLPVSNNIKIINISNLPFAQSIDVLLKTGSTTIYQGPLNLLTKSNYLNLNSNQNTELTMIFNPLDIATYDQQTLQFTIINHSYIQGGSPDQGFYDNEYIDFNIFNTPIRENRSVENIFAPNEEINILNQLIDNA